MKENQESPLFIKTQEGDFNIMKKFLGLLLVVMMMFSMVPSVFADSQITLNCNLTCDGYTQITDHNEVTKNTGDTITVIYTLENKTDENSGYKMLSHTNEIYFDPFFFEYVDGSAKVTTGLSIEAGLQKWSNPRERSVAFAGPEFTLPTYDSRQIIGTFDLKIIATEGSSTIFSGGLSIASDKGEYNLDTTDLVVKIGDAVVVPKHELKFETNGGTNIMTQKIDDGETVDLSTYKPVKDGYIFDGWYSDSALTQKITSIVMDSDKTVYAKWNAKYTGGGGGIVSDYTVSFETNGGSKIDSISKLKNSTVDLSKYITEKEGYKFSGWYSDKDLTTKIETLKVTEDTVVYAGWEKDNISTPAEPATSYVPGMLNGKEHFAYIVGYDDGAVHPEANITRAEVATIVFRLLNEDVRKSNLAYTNSFIDVSSDDWYNTAVSTMAAMNVLKGYEGYFRPNDPITRAEFAAIAARLAEKNGNITVDFNDISGHWAEPEIIKAASLGWVQGFDGYYRPDDAITRAEAMTIITRVLCRVPESIDDLHPDMKVWSDNMDTSKWYYINVQEATNSHDFEIKADNVHEKWTKLNENPDWSEIEE